MDSIKWIHENHNYIVFLTNQFFTPLKLLTMKLVYPTNEKVSKQYPPQKSMCNLKTFFVRNFNGSYMFLKQPYVLSLHTAEY